MFNNFQLNTFNGVNFVVENINSCCDDLGGADTDNSSAPVACDGHKQRRRDARSGFELEAFFRPMPEVNGSLGVTYADTKYRHNLVGTNGNALIPALFQLPGRQISNAPKWTLTGSLGWTPPIGGGGMRGLFYVDGRHIELQHRLGPRHREDAEGASRRSTAASASAGRTKRGRRGLGPEPVQQEVQAGRVRRAAAGLLHAARRGQRLLQPDPDVSTAALTARSSASRGPSA